ncbi:MAG TPA: hypothetical protein VLJ41_12780 [Segetibacter sp.]|nr:hypothetical protein [Segetibacter sp.]
MIYSESPRKNPRYKTREKKFVSVITPDRLIINEKAIFGLMLTGVAVALIALAARKG